MPYVEAKQCSDTKEIIIGNQIVDSVKNLGSRTLLSMPKIVQRCSVGHEAVDSSHFMKVAIVEVSMEAILGGRNTVVREALSKARTLFQR